MTKLDMTRPFIEGIVSRAITRLQSDPDRGLRNLIEMGLRQSRGRFQHRFFDIARQMLNDEENAYYVIARNTINSVHPDILTRFGMNLGYNSLTTGAKTIRALEEKLRFNIPWIINIHYAGKDAALNSKDVYGIVQGGKKMGIYSFALFGTATSLRDIDPIIQANHDCAFLVCIVPDTTSPQSLEWVTRRHNVLVSLSLDDEGLHDTYRMLTDAKALCCVHASYNDDFVTDTWGEVLAEKLRPYSSALVLLFTEKGCSEAAQKAMYMYITEEREKKRYPFAIIDYYQDLLAIDTVISNQPCFMAIGSDGQIYTSEQINGTGMYITPADFESTLYRVMPPVCS